MAFFWLLAFIAIGFPFFIGLCLYIVYCLLRQMRIQALKQELQRVWNENHTEDPNDVPLNEERASNRNDEELELGSMPEALP